MRFFFLVFIFFLFSPRPSFAKVFINEFLPNPVEGENEWVELYNDSTEKISLEGWRLVDGNSIDDDIYLFGCISPSGFRLFTKSGDGWLNNGGTETITLKKTTGNEDEVVYGSGGVISVPGEGKSVGRNPNGTSTWEIFDIPSPTNNACEVEVTPSPATTPTPSTTSTPTPSVTATLTPSPAVTLTPTPSTSTSVCQGVSISEIMPDPEDGGEWVELYCEEENLLAEGWVVYFDDSDESQKTDASGSFEGHYKVVEAGGNWLNNSGDTVKIVLSGEEKETYQYNSSTRGKSWSLVSGSWCETEPSKGSANNDCPSSPNTPTPTSTPIPTATPTPTSSPTLTLSPFFSPSPSSSPSAAATPTGKVLGETREASKPGTYSPSPKKRKALAFILIGAGGAISAGALLSGKKKKKKKDFVKMEDINEEEADQRS